MTPPKASLFFSHKMTLVDVHDMVYDSLFSVEGFFSLLFFIATSVYADQSGHSQWLSNGLESVYFSRGLIFEFSQINDNMLNNKKPVDTYAICLLRFNFKSYSYKMSLLTTTSYFHHQYHHYDNHHWILFYINFLLGNPLDFLVQYISLLHNKCKFFPSWQPSLLEGKKY